MELLRYKNDKKCFPIERICLKYSILSTTLKTEFRPHFIIEKLTMFPTS